jgi:hypothetical protein
MDIKLAPAGSSSLLLVRSTIGYIPTGNAGAVSLFPFPSIAAKALPGSGGFLLLVKSSHPGYITLVFPPISAQATSVAVTFFMRGLDTSTGGFVYWSSVNVADLNPSITTPSVVGTLSNKVVIGTAIL